MLFALVAELDREEYRAGVTFPQFVCAFTTDLLASRSRDHVANLFKMLDEDGSGTIRVDDMLRLAKEIGETVSTEELREMVRKVADGREELSFEDFCTVMSRKML